MRHTSRPERRRSLPEGHVESGYVDLGVEALRDLVRGSRFHEQSQRFLEVVARFLNGVPLAGNIQLGA